MIHLRCIYVLNNSQVCQDNEIVFNFEWITFYDRLTVKIS